MLLYVTLYIVLAYLMLFAALFNAVCLHNASFFSLISANAFIFIFCLGLFTNSFFFMSYLASGTVLLICRFLLIICSHGFLLFMKGLCALWRNST